MVLSQRFDELASTQSSDSSTGDDVVTDSR